MTAFHRMDAYSSSIKREKNSEESIDDDEELVNNTETSTNDDRISDDDDVVFGDDDHEINHSWVSPDESNGKKTSGVREAAPVQTKFLVLKNPQFLAQSTTARPTSQV